MALLIHRAAFLLGDAELIERDVDLPIEGNCSAAIGLTSPLPGRAKNRSSRLRHEPWPDPFQQPVGDRS